MGIRSSRFQVFLTTTTTTTQQEELSGRSPSLVLCTQANKSDFCTRINHDFDWVKAREWFSCYALPSLEHCELSRLDLQFYLFRYAFQTCHLARPKKLDRFRKQAARILFVGTVGAWPLEFASLYPKADIVCFTCSTFTSTTTATATARNNLPSNLLPWHATPTTHSQEVKLPFLDGSFDYIFQLEPLFYQLSSSAILELFSEYHRILTTTGHLELVNLLPFHYRVGPLGEILNIWHQRLYSAQGAVVQLGSSYVGEWLEEAGFPAHLVETRDRALPSGSWGGPVGQLGLKEFVLQAWDKRGDLLLVETPPSSSPNHHQPSTSFSPVTVGIGSGGGGGGGRSRGRLDECLRKFEQEASDTQAYRMLSVWLATKRQIPIS